MIASPDYVADPASLVDPLIGTSGAVNCFPGAALPFGMAQWSPDTPSRPYGGGYEYDDGTISGFSLTHLSGAGCPVFGDVPLLPTVGAVSDAPWAATEEFSHGQEEAKPGWYAVRLASGVTAHLTVTTRAGLGEFTFPGALANLLVKLTGSATAVSTASARLVGETELTGSVTSGGFCGGPNSYTLYFALQFDRPFTTAGTWIGGRLQPGGSTLTAGPADTPSGAYVTFDGRGTLRVKVGLSYVSEANARANVTAEIPGWDIAAVRRDAHARWTQLLRRIEVAGGGERDRRIFYTSLYHALLHPNVCSDVTGEYRGFDGLRHTVSDGHDAQYANFSGWDVYRCQIPLIALIARRETSDFVQSLLDAHTHGGLLPKWSLTNAETFIMVGDPAAPSIAGAFAFGARDFDTAGALAAMVRQAREPSDVRPGLDYHDRLGYLPVDGTYGCCNFYGAVSTQLEYDTADFAIAAYAAALGDTATARTLATRAQNWANVFDPGTGFLRPKLASGAFVPGFRPASEYGFVEGNAWQYTPTAPFDVRGLVNAMGGRDAFIGHLDALFTQLNAGRNAPYAWMGNEPCLATAWAYAYAGAPYKTQGVVRRVQRELYTDAPAGEPGNDDLGTMSAWFVWSAIGCYPATPGVTDLVLGSPLFPRIRVHVGNGRQIDIEAPAASHDASYVQALEINGQPWSRACLPPSVVFEGARLRFTLSQTPNRDWASDPDAAPPSYATGRIPALGFLRPDYRIVLPPGQPGTITLGVRTLADRPQTVHWTAEMPTGLTVDPRRGALQAPPSEDDCVDLRITPATEPATLAIRLTTGSGTQLPLVVLTVSPAPHPEALDRHGS